MAAVPIPASNTAIPISNTNNQTGNQTNNEGLMNPLYLHPGESPMAVLVQPLLQGSENFQAWKRSMTRALASKNKLGIVDGSIGCPVTGDRNFPIWNVCNEMVTSWILNSLSPDIRSSVNWMDNAKDVWTDLIERFGTGDAFRLSDLMEEIQSIKQGVLSVNEYYTKLKTLWEQLMILKPPPPPCTCCALKMHRDYMENEMCIRFLKGLNEAYAGVKTQVLMTAPLMSAKAACALALKQERQMNYAENTSGTTVLAARTVQDSLNVQGSMSNVVFGRGGNFDRGGRSSYGRGATKGNFRSTAGRGAPRFSPSFGPRDFGYKSMTCTYCGKNGHTVERCYAKFGYPPKFDSETGVNSMANNVEFVDTGFSGIMNDSDQVHDNETQPVDYLALTGSDNIPSGAVTQDQFNMLFNMIKNMQSGPNQASSSGVQPAVMSAVQHDMPGCSDFEADYYS